MKNILWFAVSLAMLTSQRLDASWLSDITGINIDVPRGRVEIGRPNPAAIPQMLQNLPKDVGQFFLNPGGNVLGFAIRHAKEQARYGCRPIPQQVTEGLARFFPPQAYQGVCWNVASGNRITLDSLLLRHLNNGAVTLEDVVVFPDDRGAMSVALWAHELIHVQQYRRLGLETFAHLYMYNFDAMEREAYQMQEVVEQALARDGGGSQQVLYSVQPGGFGGGPITPQQYQQQAMQAIQPTSCALWNDTGMGMLTVSNPCPVPIVLTNFLAGNRANGQAVWFPCPGPCVVPPRNSLSIPLAAPWITQQVVFRW